MWRGIILEGTSIHMSDADRLRAQAKKWRELARLTTDDRVIRTLLEMADEYDARADLMRPQPK